MTQLLDDPEFLQQSYARVEFYRQYPEIAAEDLLRVELSEVQKVVLRSMWFQDYVICIMSRGGGKTFLHGVFASLKAMLYPGHRVGLLAPTFRQAKMMFDEVDRLYKRSPILQAATEKRPTQQADNCYLRFKSVGNKNSSIIQALPLGDGTKIRGARFYSILCDEFPHIPKEIFDMVIRPMGATVADPMENVRKIKRRKSLIEKGLMTEDEAMADDHRANQLLITSSGYFTFNHLYDLYNAYKAEMQAGSTKYAVWRVPYDLLEEGFLDPNNVEAARKQMSSLEFRMEYEAAFIPDTDSFYRASLLEACSQTGFSTQVAGFSEKSYCLGIDPARKEDSFAICVVEMGKPAKIVHALELQNQPFPKMASLIEDLCGIFNVVDIYMDAQGGGLAIKDILAENNRSLREGPILDRDDEVFFRHSGRKILTMCNFSTDFIQESNYNALSLLEHKELLFPSIQDKISTAAEEESWETIRAMKSQMQMIEISVTPTGKNHFDVPKGGGHGSQKKDLYTAFMLAARCVYDHYWTEELVEDILHQGGALKEHRRNTPSSIPGMEAYSDNDIPDVMLDKLQMIQDPEGYRNRIMQGANKRTLVVAPAIAVLRPKPPNKK